MAEEVKRLLLLSLKPDRPTRREPVFVFGFELSVKNCGFRRFSKSVGQLVCCLKFSRLNHSKSWARG